MVELDFWNVPCYLKNSRQYVIPISRKKCHVIIGDFFKHRVCEPLLAKSLPNLNVKISRPDSRAWNWVQLYVTLIRLNRIRQNWKLARDSILTYHDALFEVLPKSQGCTLHRKWLWAYFWSQSPIRLFLIEDWIWYGSTLIDRLKAIWAEQHHLLRSEIRPIWFLRKLANFT